MRFSTIRYEKIPTICRCRWFGQRRETFALICCVDKQLIPSHSLFFSFPGPCALFRSSNRRNTPRLTAEEEPTSPRRCIEAQSRGEVSRQPRVSEDCRKYRRISDHWREHPRAEGTDLQQGAKSEGFRRKYHWEKGEFFDS